MWSVRRTLGFVSCGLSNLIRLILRHMCNSFVLLNAPPAARRAHRIIILYYIIYHKITRLFYNCLFLQSTNLEPFQKTPALSLRTITQNVIPYLSQLFYTLAAALPGGTAKNNQGSPMLSRPYKTLSTKPPKEKRKFIHCCHATTGMYFK